MQLKLSIRLLYVAFRTLGFGGGTPTFGIVTLLLSRRKCRVISAEQGLVGRRSETK
jgi:hypothetical protein